MEMTKEEYFDWRRLIALRTKQFAPIIDGSYALLASVAGDKAVGATQDLLNALRSLQSAAGEYTVSNWGPETHMGRLAKEWDAFVASSA
jgi:hypothetical protein